MGGHHLGVVDKAAGGQHHGAQRADKARLRDALLDGRSLASAGHGLGRTHQAPARHLRMQLRMTQRLRVVFRQSPDLHAQHRTVLAVCTALAHQAAHGGLRQRHGACAQRGRTQGGVELFARLPLAQGAVAARGRRADAVLVGRHLLVARVVEKFVFRWVGGFVRRHACVKAQTLILEPAQIGHAISAKARNRRFADRALHFLGQVARHGLGRVTETGLLLVGRAAAGIDHAAGQGAGAAALKTVDYQYAGALAACLNGRAGTGSAPADD